MMLNIVGTKEFVIDFECDNPNKIEYKIVGRAIGLQDLSECESTSDLHKLYFNLKEKADYPINGFTSLTPFLLHYASKHGIYYSDLKGKKPFNWTLSYVKDVFDGLPYQLAIITDDYIEFNKLIVMDILSRKYGLEKSHPVFNLICNLPFQSCVFESFGCEGRGFHANPDIIKLAFVEEWLKQGLEVTETFVDFVIDSPFLYEVGDLNKFFTNLIYTVKWTPDLDSYFHLNLDSERLYKILESLNCEGEIESSPLLSSYKDYFQLEKYIKRVGE